MSMLEAIAFFLMILSITSTYMIFRSSYEGRSYRSSKSSKKKKNDTLCVHIPFYWCVECKNIFFANSTHQMDDFQVK